MEQQQEWREALEAGDDAKLQRLCRRLDSNFDLKVGGYKGYTNNEFTQSVAHHVACKARSSLSLRLLVQRLGASCLSSRNSSDETPVHCAAQHQDASWMELAEEAAGPDCFGKSGQSGRKAIHYAATNQRSNSSLKWIVKTLGNQCLSVPDKYGYTPVHLAAEYQGVDSMELIKREIGTDCFRLKGGDGRTAAHCTACNSSSNEVLKWIVAAIGGQCLSVPNKYGDTPVHLAARHQGVDSMELIKREIGADCFRLKGRASRTAAHIAACNESSNELLKWIVKTVGSQCLSVPDNYGYTPVHLAAQHQGVDSMELIKREIGTDCFRLKGGDGRTAAHRAARNRTSHEVLKWIVKTVGGQCLSVPDKYGDTPVHLAAGNQGVDSMELIKSEIGTDCFRLKGGDGRTAAHIAACNKSSNEVLKWIVKTVGSQCLSIPDNKGDTPVHIAAQHQGIDSMELIEIEIGTDCFRLKGEDGRTAAHCAACNQSSNEVLKWIVAAIGGQCLSVPDHDGDTPVHLAARYQSINSLQFLADQLGPQIFAMKNNKGQTLADCVEKDWYCDRKHTKRAWIASQQSRRPPPEPQQPQPSEIGSSARAPTVLDASFASWDFILGDDGKKQVIGEGGFGKVCTALTDRFQTVAVKIVKLGAANQSNDEEAAIERERRGIEILSGLSHPNIVQFLKCERAKDGRLLIFTELVTGRSLSDLMDRQKKPFAESGVKNFSRQICSALNFLHKQPQTVLHRDIKCSNIMLTNDGVIKLIDFGLAKVIEGSCARGDYRIGTWHFMAPEQFGEEVAVYSVKTDVWALGCTVFEMTEMQPPNGDLKSQQIPTQLERSKKMPQSDKMSEDLKDFYLRCVTWEPTERADTEELLKHRFLKD